jgi:hypothetical protein
MTTKTLSQLVEEIKALARGRAGRALYVFQRRTTNLLQEKGQSAKEFGKL